MTKVLKFGGTSVAGGPSIKTISSILKSQEKEGSMIVVVSALGGVTNQLIQIGQSASEGLEYETQLDELEKRHLKLCTELIKRVNNRKACQQKIKSYFRQLRDICKGIFWVREITQKTSDYLLSYGETLSSCIISDYFIDYGLKCELKDPTEFIITDSRFGKARVDFKVSGRKIRASFKELKGIAVIPGFIASNGMGQVTTLGRGGSDYSAAIIASALNASVLEIWTDVDGLMTADPRFVRSARTIRTISYEDAMELSHFGAKVIYPPTIQPVLDKRIDIHVKNTFNVDSPGTVITGDETSINGRSVKGLSCIQNIVLLNLKGSGMVGIPNFSHRLFKCLADEKVNIILITQASSEHSICIAIDEIDASKAEEAVNTEFEYELSTHKLDPVEIESDLSVIALVGSRMRHQVGISGRLFNTLGSNGINVKAIAQGSSERNISVVVDSFQVKKALNSLHESFFLSDFKRINLFIIGVGTVGSAFLAQIKQQAEYLREKHKLNIQVTGLANSRKMLFSEEGISLRNWKKKLDDSKRKFSLASFKREVFEMNQRNSIFIDNTASEEVAREYLEFLEHSISVITPNKIACSSDFSLYQTLKETATRRNQKFFFETNVGAGLPVISTLNDLIKSGDRVRRIEAVLSGSLNFIFNTYKAKRSFSSIIQQAMEEGYTEPDPRIDLSGVDVKRKILILMRESGYTAELEDIETENFIPEKIMKAKDVKSFLKLVEENEEEFRNIFDNATSEGKKIKYVASFDNGKASTGLKMIDKNHPFYDLEGKDNIVLFYTDRYPDQPLVIKGAGAGAAVTASGIFADVIRYAN